MTSLLQHSDWLNGRVPDAVRAKVRGLVEVVGYLPYQQPLGVITADAVLLAANRPLLDLLGVTGDEQLGADWDDFMPGWTGRVSNAEPGAAPEPSVRTFEDYLLPVTGDPVWVKVVASPVFTPGPGGDSGEALAAWAVSVVDQSPRQYEPDDGRRRAILELLLESPSEFVVQLGADGSLEYLSPSLRRELGMFGDGLAGKPLAAAHELAGSAFAEAYPRLMEELSAPPYRCELEMAMLTGEAERIVQWRFESFLADGGAVRGVLGMGRDVTDHRRAERERERSELQLRTLVEATSRLTWTTGPGGAVVARTDGWATFTGQTGDEMAGDGWADAVHPDDRERVLASWTEAVAGRRAYTCEYRLRTEAGEYCWIEAHAVPLEGSGGEPYYFGVGQDISERKRAEESARRRLDLLSMGGEISSRIANATLESAPAVVDHALVEVGRRLGADRVGLYLLEADAIRLRAVRIWRRAQNLLEDGDPALGLEGMDWLRSRLAEGSAVAVESPAELPPEAGPERRLFEEMGLGAVVVVPVNQDPTLVGLLSLGVNAEEETEDAGRRWDDDDLHLLRLVADQLAGLLMWRADELNLRSVSERFLAFGPDVAANLTEICRAAADVTSADIVLYNRRRGDELVTETGWHVPDDMPRVTKAAGRACGDLLAGGGEKVLVIHDLQDSVYAHTSPIIGRYHLDTYAAFPVLVGGQAIATLCCLFAAGVVLRESQLELLRVLGRAAAVEEERRHAIEDRVLGLAALEQAMERTVGTLSGAMSTRDPYTTGHERRVSELAVAIGGKLGMTPDELRLLRLAATVHDIGKISIPAEILSKPTRLSEAEFAIIKGHSEAGKELLDPAGLPTPVTDAVLQHHERLDGSGYPAGLGGDEIGEFARILAVADVVEAMSSNRPYRPAIGVKPALEEIELGRGSRYDDRVAGACIRLFRDEGFAFTE